MNTWQERLHHEEHELSERVDKLSVFLRTKSDVIDAEQAILLSEQLSYMQRYLAILRRRIQLL